MPKYQIIDTATRAEVTAELTAANHQAALDAAHSLYTGTFEAYERSVHTLADLQIIVADGRLHHCTVRDPGRMFEALHIYTRAEGDSGFRGFRHVGSIPAHDLDRGRDANGQLQPNPEYRLAMDATRGNWNLGSLGNG